VSDEDLDPTTAEFPVVDRRGLGKLYDADRHPRQRHSDEGVRYWLGWLYRNTVPALAIIVAAFAVAAAHDATVKASHNAARARDLSARNRRAVVAIQEGRKAAVGESCKQDERIADVVRKALLGFGVGERGHPAPRGVVQAFRPLGGLKPLTAEEQAARCRARIRRGAGP
jgi:hypothetical protein